MLTMMQRQHLIAEGAALKAGRSFSRLRVRYFTRQPDNTAHVKAWREHKIDLVLDHFINTYSLRERELAGGPL